MQGTRALAVINGLLESAVEVGWSHGRGAVRQVSEYHYRHQLVPLTGAAAGFRRFVDSQTVALSSPGFQNAFDQVRQRLRITVRIGNAARQHIRKPTFRVSSLFSDPKNRGGASNRPKPHRDQEHSLSPMLNLSQDGEWVRPRNGVHLPPGTAGQGIHVVGRQ